MGKYKALAIIYLLSVISSSIANLLGVDVQNLYRIPFINFRWIDIANLFVAFMFLKSLLVKSVYSKRNSLIISLCFVYLIFELFQLFRSWGATDAGWQISGILCTVNFFILIDLAMFPLDEKKIVEFLNIFCFWGSIALTISNAYLFYSFISGNVVLQDLDIRVGIDVIGAKETVSTVTLLPLVYLGNLYFIQNNGSVKAKAVHFISLLSILVILIIRFHRGDLVTITLLTVIYFFFFSARPSQAINKMAKLGLVVLVGYFLFANTLTQKGYDPVDKLSQLAEFAVDTKSDSWDKGRSIPEEYALSGWKQNFWLGVGYIDLHHYGLPEGMGSVHNFVIASLFYRGIIGTSIYLLILLILYANAIKFWLLLRGQKSFQDDVFKMLIVVSFFWFIPFWTQDVMWERYSLSIQFLYLGIITNIYNQISYPRFNPAPRFI